MALRNALPGRISQSTPPHIPFTTPSEGNELDPDSENPDEWEYEYSTTETETIYVTLDLTTDDIAPQKRASRAAGGGGAKAKWINPALGRPKRKMAMDRTGEKGLELKTNAQKRPATDNIDDDAPASPADSAGFPDEDAADDEAAKLQILGLHTKNPIISYNGTVFSCQWASNIGTELLFTARDANLESNLPVLKQLPGEVDLLGVSSIRIISNVVTLLSKDVEFQFSSQKSGQKNKHIPTNVIPLGTRSSAERKSQAHFLEKLMDIKAARGETDEVTIYASTRLTRIGWKNAIEQKRTLERRNLEKTLKSKKLKDVRNHASASERLLELDKEQEMLKAAAETWEKESRPHGKGRVRMVEKEDKEPSRKRKKIFKGVGSPRESVPASSGLGESFFIGEIDENDEEMEGTVDEIVDSEGDDDDGVDEDDDTQMAY